MSLKSRLLVSSVLAGALCASFQPAGAQTAAKPSVANGGGETLSEIVVTAQKRSENIMSVGMAITAVTGRQLQQQGVTQVSDLTRIEPSLQFSQTQSGTPVYTLRGVGYFEQSLSASPTVSIYQDEVAYPYPVMARAAMLDPDHVEVLKGPQGTLYGQNATGGAINFIAAKPTATFHAGADVSYGSYNDALLSGFVGGPLVSGLTGRLALSSETSDGWQKSVTRQATLGAKDTQLGRLILDWKPTDKFTAALTLSGWRDRSETQAGQLEGFRFQSPLNVNNTLDPFNPASYLPVPGTASYPTPIKNVLAEPIAPHNARAADWVAGTRPHNDETFYQANLRLDYALTGSLGVTSLSSYQRFQEHNLVDDAGTSSLSEASTVNGFVDSFSQELRLHGTFDAGKVRWLIGANYERDRVYEKDDVGFVSTASYAPEAASGGVPPYAIPPDTTGTPGQLGPFLQFAALNTDTTITKSVFANIEYQAFDSLKFHGGIRYTESDQNLSGCSESNYLSVNIAQYFASLTHGGSPSGIAVPGTCTSLGPPPALNPGLITNTLNQSNVPWRVGVDWTPFAHSLFYFTVSKGFKAGSSPALGASTYAQLKPVTQEALLSYEVGAKADLFDRTLDLTAAAFHYDYTNKQELGRTLDLLGIYGAVQTLLNVPKSTEDGAEFSVVWRPLSGLTLNAAATYLDSKVTSDFFEDGPYPLGSATTAVPINFKGEAFPYTPKWSLHYGARYEWSVWSDMTAFVAADGSYQTRSSTEFGAIQAAEENAPPLEIKSYAIVNISAGFNANRWRFEVWGKNVGNTYYWNSVNYITDTVVRETGMPATYGVSVSYRY
jgi:outer membrane receptor protein involved in Fe transport